MKFSVLSATLLCVLLSFIVVTQARILGCKNGKKLLGMKIMDGEAKKKILDAHNKLRNYVASGKQTGQPPAENMLELTWDTYAEKQAYAWASGCIFEHNQPKDTDNRPMGQNLYIKMYTLKQDVQTTFNDWIDEMIKGWYDEVKDYSYGDEFKSSTGHYTQVVWANSAKLGCGYSYFLDGRWYTGYLVCNYTPAGNYYGQLPYVAGKSNCKKHNLLSSYKYSNLCLKK